MITHKKTLLHLDNSCRDGVLRLFNSNPGIAFSESEIKKRLNKEFNRTSIFRVVKVLVEEKVIHSVISDHKALRYALTIKLQEGTHAHLKCTVCDKVYCMNERIPMPEYPTHCLVREQQILLTGLCGDCLCKMTKASI
ncbi:hypothetical protein BH10BAC4_BH10BAC4_18430 [soil metagenome]